MIKEEEYSHCRTFTSADRLPGGYVCEVFKYTSTDGGIEYEYIIYKDLKEIMSFVADDLWLPSKVAEEIENAG